MYLRANASMWQQQGNLHEASAVLSQTERLKGNSAARPPPLHIDVDHITAAPHTEGVGSRPANSQHVPQPLPSSPLSLSRVLPASLLAVLCPLPAATPSLFASVPAPLSPSTSAAFLPATLSIQQAVRSSLYHDVEFFIQQGADVTATDDEGEEERSAGLTLTDEVMRVAMQAGETADDGAWPAILLLLLQHGAPTELSASLTADTCGLPRSTNGQLRWTVCRAHFLAITRVALALMQQRHAEQFQAAAAHSATLLSTHQTQQDRLVDALTALQLDEEREGRERNKQTATALRYQLMATQLRERERTRQRRREAELALREADIRAAYVEREKKVRSLLAEISRVRAEDRKLTDEVEARRLHLHDTTSSFDLWLKRRQTDRAELLRLETETEAMEEQIRQVRQQRSQIRQLRIADGQLRLPRLWLTVECGASDVQYVMEKRRKQRSNLFFRFHRAVRPSSATPLSSQAAMQFETDPCVQSAVFPAAATSLPLSAASLSNPSWPPLTVDVFSLCSGDETESIPFRVVLCDSNAAPVPAHSVRSITTASAVDTITSPSKSRSVRASPPVAVVGVSEVSVGQLRRSGGGGLHILMRADEQPDAALAGVFRFMSLVFSDDT